MVDQSVKGRRKNQPDATLSFDPKSENIAKINGFTKRHNCGQEAPDWTWTNFYTLLDIHNVITCTIFGDKFLGVLEWQGVKFYAFYINLHHHPYDTFALLCRCAIHG